MSKRETTTRQRRSLIVEAAAECFIKKGFHQASIRDIARTAGVSLGNLYNHFAGKDDLIAEFAVIEAEMIDRLTGKVDLESNPLRALERFTLDYLDMARDPANAALTMELTAEALRNPDIERDFSANRQTLIDLVSNVLTRGRASGAFGASLPVDEEANVILDVIEGLALRSAFSGREMPAVSRTGLIATIAKIVRAP